MPNNCVDDTGLWEVFVNEGKWSFAGVVPAAQFTDLPVEFFGTAAEYLYAFPAPIKEDNVTVLKDCSSKEKVLPSINVGPDAKKLYPVRSPAAHTMKYWRIRGAQQILAMKATDERKQS